MLIKANFASVINMDVIVYCRKIETSMHLEQYGGYVFGIDVAGGAQP